MMKNKINTEYENYKKYLKNYFPQTTLLSKVDTAEFKFFFDRTLTFSKICDCLSDNNICSEYTNLISYNLNNLLYFLPLNEKISINMSIRNSVEYLIKLINHFQNPDKSFLNDGYRSLKDKRNTLDAYQYYKNEIDLLFNIYAIHSNNIHLKNITGCNLSDILEDKLKNASIDTKNLKEFSDNIDNSLDIFFNCILYYKINLSTAEKLSLGNLVSTKRKNQIYKEN